jgi:hypothetical protein
MLFSLICQIDRILYLEYEPRRALLPKKKYFYLQTTDRLLAAVWEVPQSFRFSHLIFFFFMFYFYDL